MFPSATKYTPEKSTRNNTTLNGKRPAREIEKQIIRLPTGKGPPEKSKSNKASRMPKTKRWRA